MNREIMNHPNKTQIYDKCDELLHWFSCNHKLNCSADEVEHLTNEILQVKEGIEYMKQNNEFFEKVYISHFETNDKTFIKMNKTQSLITSILMHMWH
jgi:hypothetical protein